MSTAAHKTEGGNRTQKVRFAFFVFIGNDHRKGWRIPLNEIKYSKQYDKKTCCSYCDEYQPHAVKRMFDYNGLRHFDLRWDDAGWYACEHRIIRNTEVSNLEQVCIADRDALFETGRFLFWTVDGAAQSERRANSFVFQSQSGVGVANRMHASVDDNFHSYYSYDHGRERRLSWTEAYTSTNIEDKVRF